MLPVLTTRWDMGIPWILYSRIAPLPGRTIVIMRDDWESPQGPFESSMDPALNIEGLYWRYVEGH